MTHRIDDNSAFERHDSSTLYRFFELLTELIVLQLFIHLLGLFSIGLLYLPACDAAGSYLLQSQEAGGLQYRKYFDIFFSTWRDPDSRRRYLIELSATPLLILYITIWLEARTALLVHLILIIAAVHTFIYLQLAYYSGFLNKMYPQDNPRKQILLPCVYGLRYVLLSIGFVLFQILSLFLAERGISPIPALCLLHTLPIYLATRFEKRRSQKNR
ncbi:MAG: hypothetical protein Q4P72_01265 [Eubacteriales bacterium]|nr:hypothetical protein [Eubacteriales bacterium]